MGIKMFSQKEVMQPNFYFPLIYFLIWYTVILWGQLVPGAPQGYQKSEDLKSLMYNGVLFAYNLPTSLVYFKSSLDYL